jgi:hypothetical protein
MDPVQKMWMYQNWLADQSDQAELAKNHAYLLGSFWDPEAVKQLMGQGNVHISTDEEFEESTRIVQRASEALNRKKKQENNTGKRKRRIIKG